MEHNGAGEVPINKQDRASMTQKTLRVLFIGDVVGTPGLQMVGRMLKSFISSHHIDFVVCNGENAHNGKGMSVDALNQLLEAGVNVVTGGNHTWSNFNFFDTLKLILRSCALSTIQKEPMEREWAFIAFRRVWVK